MTGPNFQNRTLFHGDNLDFLRGMNSETVDLVATDPPFNKSKDFHATPDSLAKGARFTDRWSWDKDVHPEWMDDIEDDWPTAHAVIELARTAYGDDMGAYLCWLGVRLMECHRVLKPTGSLYLHIDHTAHAYVKTLLDAIFGKKNFRNETVWHYSGWNKRLRHNLERRHDTILFYTKSDDAPFNYPTEPWESEEEYIRKRKQKVHTGDDGRKYVLSDGGGGTRVRRYLDEAMAYGKPLDDVWLGIDKLNNSDAENTGYPTQKPLALYERFIKASSNRDDFVLDPFCGCATTPIAAERQGRQWVGMDEWDTAYKMVLDRLELEGLAVPNEDDERYTSHLLTFGDVYYSSAPPVRTDGGQQAAPELVLKAQILEPPGPRMTHAEMKEVLIEQNGIVCRGCLRRFDDARYLDLDHNTPRSDGGINHISNRLLLCGPCNRAKSNKLTLSGLRALNSKNGWMARE